MMIHEKDLLKSLALYKTFEKNKCMKALKKIIHNLKKSSFKKELELEHRRLFISPLSERTFRKKRRIPMRIPDLFKKLTFNQSTLKYIYVGV